MTNSGMNDKNGHKVNNIHKELRILAKDSFYSILYIYGSFISLLFISFFKARLISQDAWNNLILATSFVSIFLLVLTFFPPGLENTLNYYIPRYNSLNEKNKLKILIIRALILKILFVILIFVISIFLFLFMSDLFAISLTIENVDLLFILSPLIIIDSLNLLLISVNQSFHKFNVNFNLMLIKYSFNIGSLAYYFFFIKVINIETVAFITVLSSSIPFIINLSINVNRILKLEPKTKDKIPYVEDLQKFLKYGSPIRFGKFLTDIWGQFQIQTIGFFDKDMLVGFSISKQYLSVSLNATSSLLSPLTIAFTKLDVQKNDKQIEVIYNLLIKYSLFLMLLITGILYICTDFFLAFFFGNSFLIFSNLVKIYLFSYVFLIFSGQFESLLLSKNKVKYIPMIRGLILIIRVPIFLTLLIFFNLIIAIIGVLIINLFYGVIIIILTIKIGKIKLNIKTIVYQYLAFFLTIGIIIVLQFIGLNELNYFILKSLNLLIFQEMNFLALGLFLIVFLSSTIIFKTFVREDIQNLDNLFSTDKRLHRITKSVLRILKKIVRK